MASNTTQLTATALNVGQRSYIADLWPIALVYSLIMAGVWTPPGPSLAVIALLMLGTAAVFAVRGGYSASQLGLTQPSRGAVPILTAGVLLAVLLAILGPAVTKPSGYAHVVPLQRAWQYAIWAVAQEFILQSLFFLRLESLIGGKRAVWVASLLFAAAHIPNPLLTPLSFLGSLLFCEMFRRYRNLYPIGVIHALLGLTIAASLPDSLLHHMRVGIGYLLYHP